MKLYSYAMRYDTGFAPNPFHRCCTLGLCTPNHQRARVRRGDWVLGNANLARRHALVYVMQVSDILDFGDYFDDPHFQVKKPRFDTTWQDACGDNIYQRVGGSLVQRATLFHLEPDTIAKDTKNPVAYIGGNFFYFGSNTPLLPGHLERLICRGRGVRCNHAPQDVDTLVRWLDDSFLPGVLGDPWDAAMTRRALAQRTGDHLIQLGLSVSPGHE